MDGKPTNSHTKAKIIYDLMVSPRLRSDIVSKYSKQSSKGIYRHLTDLESDKIIREVKTKGTKPLLVLNEDNLPGLSKALSYLMDVKPEIGYSLDKAFVECAISAYGDFPIMGAFVDPNDEDIPKLTLKALIDGKRPEIDDRLLLIVMETVKKYRGDLTIKDKIYYISMVDDLSHSDWSREKMPPVSLSMPYLFTTAEREMKNGNGQFYSNSWFYAVYNVILIAQGRREHFLDKIKDSREIELMTKRMELYYASILPISDIDRTALSTKLYEKFLTPEQREVSEREKVRDISQLPEVYRKDYLRFRKETENEKYEEIPLSQMKDELKISTQSPNMKIPPRKKHFKLFK